MNIHLITNIINKFYQHNLHKTNIYNFDTSNKIIKVRMCYEEPPRPYWVLSKQPTRLCSPGTSALSHINQATLGNQLTTERVPTTTLTCVKTLCMRLNINLSNNNSPSHYWANVTKPQKKERKKERCPS